MIVLPAVVYRQHNGRALRCNKFTIAPAINPTRLLALFCQELRECEQPLLF
jgi:hypothetical protein